MHIEPAHLGARPPGPITFLVPGAATVTPSGSPESSAPAVDAIESNSTELIRVESDPIESAPREASTSQSNPTEPKPVDLTHGLGPVLRAMRRARNLTQRQVGLLAGVSCSLISEVERGGANLSIDMLWRLCTALAVRPHIAIRGKDSDKPLLQLQLEQVGPAKVGSE